MVATERVIHGYVHQSRIGVLVEFCAETDYATRTTEFAELARDIALHIAASAPASLEALLAQPFVRDPAMNVGQLLARASGTLRESIAIRRFVRWDTDTSPSPSLEPPNAPAVALRMGA